MSGRAARRFVIPCRVIDPSRQHDETMPLSIVSPAHNEAENVRQLVMEITAAMEPLGISHEIVIVDDGSTDATRSVLLDVATTTPTLRVLAMEQTAPGRGNGQSAAFHAGFRACRGAVIAVLDADLQNNPADLPAMLTLMEETGADMVQGDRSHDRRDNFRRKIGMVGGRIFRRLLLGDTIRDTGCSLRVMRRDVALALPLQFRGMHRYIPVTARQMGFTVVETPVRHRPRVAGQAKYGLLDRGLVGLPDCFAVRWMRARRRPTTFSELTPDVTKAPAERRNRHHLPMPSASDTISS